MDNRSQLTQKVFHRIGHRFGNYFDPNHFLGQDALEGKTKPSIQKNGSTKNQSFFEIEVKTTGFKKDEIKIELEGQELHVSALSKLERLRDGFLTCELCCEGVDYTITLPDNVAKEDMKIQHGKGKVSIKIPYKN